MSLLYLLSREARAPRSTLLLMAGISGAANVTMLAIVNGAANHLVAGATSISLLILYLIALAIHAISQHYTRTRLLDAVIVALQGLRLRLIDTLRRSDWPLIETNREAAALQTLWSDAASWVNGAMILVSVSQSMLLIVLAGLYLAVLSPLALAFVVVIGLLFAPISIHAWRRTLKEIEQVEAAEADIERHQDRLLQGLEALKLDERESERQFEVLREQARRAYRLRAASTAGQARAAVVRRVIGYAIPFAVVFLVPLLVPGSGDNMLNAAVTVLLGLAALMIISDMLPVLARFQIAVKQLYALEARANLARASAEAADAGPVPAEFRSIEWVGLEYQYPSLASADAFRLGPIDLRVQRGERLLIQGDNASGKSTLVKLLTGLYRPTAGSLLVAGQPITDRALGPYRRLFAVVLDDADAPRSLHGLPTERSAAVAFLLEQLDLEGIAGVDDEPLQLSLSPGQRKRLAVLAALTSDRPVCVFDDLGSGLDPQMRRRLHETILPRLSALGRTLILVSSDFDGARSADRVLCLRDGRLVECSPDAD